MLAVRGASPFTDNNPRFIRVFCVFPILLNIMKIKI